MSLRNIFENLSRKGDKFEHYFPLYEKWFSPYLNKPVSILEVGVYRGGSAEMWTKWFGKDLKLTGVDIDPKTKRYESNNVEIIIGDQGSAEFWKTLSDRKFDIIIDDGSHENSHQIQTLISTYRLLKDGGIYWCEDTHTSYYSIRENGGYKNPNSFVEYTKNLIDVIHSHHTNNAVAVGEIKGTPVPNNFVELYNNIQGIHFYDSVVVIEKGPRLKFERIIRKAK
jgi:ubiquinone/menaquinone biosynthesis C-methylase UbiE